MAEVIPIGKLTSERKAALIGEALQRLRAAHVLDERDGLDVASLLAWYDATIPDVKDVKILAGEIEVEILRRHGQFLLQEGERRGRPEKLSHRESIPTAMQKRRYKERLVASQPAAVDAYVARERKAQRAPSGRGAIRAAKTARVATIPKPHLHEPVPYGVGVRSEVRKRIESVRGLALTLEELAVRWDVHTDTALRYLREASCLGEVVKDEESRFTVTFSALEDFKKTLRAEINVQRKEARDGKRWMPDNVHTAKQTALLNWIESQLL